MCGILIHIGMYEVIFVFVQDTIDSRSTFYFHTQLIILLGKYNIHAKKWAKAKPKREHFLKEIKLYGIICTILETEKRKRPMKHYVSLIWLIQYLYSFLAKILVCYFDDFFLSFSVYPFSFVFVIFFLLLL